MVMGLHPPKRRRRLGRKLLIFFAVLALGGWLSLRPVAPDRLRPPVFESLHLYDRNGIALGESLSSTESSATWTPLERFSPDLLATAVAAEDRRFFHHPGLDARAILRAIRTNLGSGRTRSGASTITQQVARMILADEARAAGEPTPPRSIGQKVLEAHLALRLERSFSKRQILEAWLNRVPVGGVALGMGAGAERYFGVHPSALSLEQSALLVGLPRGPSSLRPDRESRAARARRNRVLEALVEVDPTARDRVDAVLKAPVFVKDPRTQPMRARLGAWAARALAEEGRVIAGAARTTIDRRLENEILTIAQEHIRPLRERGVKSAAVVVIDHTTDELLALVGAADESDPRWGQVHAAFALRQPGSALKPFVYLSALEQGRTLASLAADVEQAFPDLRGAYLPQNYDRTLHGPVRFREALAQSLNVAAVDVLRQGGLQAAAEVLERAGISTISRRPEYYGLGLTLGSLDVQLLELTEAYAVLARGGVGRPTRILQDAPRAPEGTRIFDERLTWLLGDALSDANARAPQFGFNSVLRTPYWTAVKTGTSKGFRDNLCLGFSRRYTVGVWVGDPEGKPMEHVSGVTGAGPIWRAVMDRLHAHEPSVRPPEPAGLVHRQICPLSGALVGPDCPGAIDEAFAEGTDPKATCAMHRHVRLANSDGRIVPDTCAAPAGPPELRTVFPSPYDAWAERESRGISDAWSTSCPPPPVPAGLKPTLLAPARYEVVRLDDELPRERQQMLLLADAAGYQGTVRFLVDGKDVPDRIGPRAALWTVTAGRHKLTAKVGEIESEAHTIEVR